MNRLLFTFCVSIFRHIFSFQPKLAMYWVDQTVTNPLIPLETIPSWVDHVIIGFATMNLDNSITFPYNTTMIQQGISYLQSKNHTISISIGGSANCGPKGISQDLMFGQSNFNPIIWAQNVKTNLIDIYGLQYLDIDYECRDLFLQNPINVQNGLKELKILAPNISISFVAFSVVTTPNNWENYLQAFLAVQPYIDIIYWATYNINLNNQISESFYSSANITSMTKLGYNSSSIFYGYCTGSVACVYGLGPSFSQIILWANAVKKWNNGGGLFLWTIQDEIALYQGNFTIFNTTGISKKVADILHA